MHAGSATRATLQRASQFPADSLPACQCAIGCVTTENILPEIDAPVLPNMNAIVHGEHMSTAQPLLAVTLLGTICLIQRPVLA